MTIEAARVRFPWGLTIVCVLACVLLVSLGVWQVQRMQWKAGLIAEAEAAATHPPVPVMQVYRPRHEFRSVIIDCPGLATAPFVEMKTIENGEIGVRLISACPLPSKPFVTLIDRGFVSAAISARPSVRPSNESVRIIGQLRMPPKPSEFAPPPEGDVFYARDHLAMGRALGVRKWLASPMIFATTSSNPEWLALEPSAPPAAFSNNHLGYALTWFGLALALAGFYIVLLRRKLTS
ncbi:MAG: SURF1 family protein [Brevundimonas sp.]|uniref:SURF1 family protein n=1 Tax=Brevundimonas sp. TaxID=1871086 RepID=UPI002488BF07|nr:SURF1 family protein [Brevundimonas sp.]MDI1328378.1 SURF1 family protein [Brevundimonas sp.]